MDDTNETLNAGRYQAYRSPDHEIELYDAENHLCTLPHDFPVALLPRVAEVFWAGYLRGHTAGEVEKARQICQALLL
ncbi:MAG: hypothetical protein PGN33_21985 [Methylobacterium radiotolerans]